MKNYRTEIVATAFLALLMLSILIAAPWRGQLPQTTPPPEPTPALTLPPGTTPPSANTGDTPTPANTEDGFLRCTESVTGLCLVSVGVDSLSGGTVFSLNIRDTILSEDLYLLVNTETSNRYECQAVTSLPNILYCSGPFIVEGTRAKIEVYTRTTKRLLAAGTLLITAEATPQAGSTPTPVYPSYPSYP